MPCITGWSYGFPDLSDPGLAIPVGEYTVQIETISTNAHSYVATFVLRNQGPNTTDIELPLDIK
jgi:hypothetical protein